MDNAEHMEFRSLPPFWFRAFGGEGACTICHEPIKAGELIGDFGEMDMEFAHEDCVVEEVEDQREESAS